MTSRRAQRRALARATLATRPAAPGRELEQWRRAEVASGFGGEVLAAAIPRAPGSTEPEHERSARLADDALRARILAANWAAGDPARLGLGLKAWREVTRVTVPANLHRDRVPGSGRPTECYQQALAYVLDHYDHDVILVHGLVQERGRLWAHAWCEVSGEAGTAVYDPTPGEFYDHDDYYRVLQPTVVGVFTPEQAAAMAITEGSAGPWGAYSPGRPGYVLTLEAVASLSEDYARTFPEMFAWVQRMRSHDDRFAGDLAELVKRDLLAIADLLASLAERPDLWREHEPGSAPWPWTLAKHPESARVIYPRSEAT
jgi:hypothetical protein